MKCLWCNQDIQPDLSLKVFLSFQTIKLQSTCQICLKSFLKSVQQRSCQFCCKEISGNNCLECKHWKEGYQEVYERHYSLFQYDKAMKDWFQQFKFQGNYRLGAMFKEEIHAFFQQHPGALVIPVPLSAERLAERGFNQVEVLLSEAGVPYQNLLVKVAETVEQTKKTRQERLASSQPFKLVKRAHLKIHNRKVIIVDDVYTTGRTIFHCVDCLKRAVPATIMSVTLAR